MGGTLVLAGLLKGRREHCFRVVLGRLQGGGGDWPSVCRVSWISVFRENKTFPCALGWGGGITVEAWASQDG